MQFASLVSHSFTLAQLNTRLATLQEGAGKRLPLTEGALSDAFQAIRRSVPEELAGGLPREHPLLSLLPGSQPASEIAVSPLIASCTFIDTHCPLGQDDAALPAKAPR